MDTEHCVKLSTERKMRPRPPSRGHCSVVTTPLINLGVNVESLGCADLKNWTRILPRLVKFSLEARPLLVIKNGWKKITDKRVNG